MSLYNVYQTTRIGDRDFGTYVRSVDAATAGDAEDLVCRLKWIARTSLKAYPDESDPWRDGWPRWAPMMLEMGRKVGRPVERDGDYQRITLEVRRDLLDKLDRRPESRRELIERLLDNEFSAIS